MAEILCVVAYRYVDAKGFATKQGVSPLHLRYIDSREKIMGLRGIKLYVLKGAERRDDFHEIMLEACAHGFEIVYTTL